MKTAKTLTIPGHRFEAELWRAVDSCRGQDHALVMRLTCLAALFFLCFGATSASGQQEQGKPDTDGFQVPKFELKGKLAKIFDIKDCEYISGITCRIHYNGVLPLPSRVFFTELDEDGHPGPRVRLIYPELKPGGTGNLVNTSAFIGTNPTDEPITRGLPVIHPESAESNFPEPGLSDRNNFRAARHPPTADLQRHGIPNARVCHELLCTIAQIVYGSRQDNVVQSLTHCEALASGRCGSLLRPESNLRDMLPG